jgi:hypothetical protein
MLTHNLWTPKGLVNGVEIGEEARNLAGSLLSGIIP